ncbi:hypothetical protein AVEN_198916-1 [Araneus ventricosus]|uniref:Uncharacterized protein n=1 Tax=Araneus ventricosus TaxID=182803 RepID=A0A4Y2MM43_ARAVE|nr:hypothetical protein AVEN_198916-1 [Araneus ventricosus]
MDKGRKALEHITFPHSHHGCSSICAIGKPIYRNRHRRNRAQIAESLNEGFLNVGNGSEMVTCQVFLQRYEDMKITRCEIRALGRVFQYLCG